MKFPHIPCEEAAINVEKALWHQLSWVNWLKTRWHMVLCQNCRSYEKDSHFLHRVLCNLKKDKNVDHISDDEKEKLKKALEN